MNLFSFIKPVNPLLVLALLIVTQHSLPALANTENSSELRDINAQLLESINLLKEKQYAQACVKLKLLPELKNVASNDVEKQLQLNIFYLQGQCFSGLGLYDEAKEYFLKVIADDPNQPRPYLDLALIYQYLGEFSAAEGIYKRVLRLPTLNSDIKDKISRMRNVNPEMLSYTLEVAAGGLHDDNLINLPSADTITIYGDKELVLGDNLRPSPTQGLFLGVNASVTKLLSNDNRITAKINVESSTYPQESKGDTVLTDLTAGYHKKIGESEYGIEPRFASISLGGEVLLNVTALTARYTTFFSSNIRISPMLEYLNYSYTGDSARDVSILMPQLMASYTYSPELIFNGLLAIGTATANEDIHSYDNTILELGVKYKFNPNLILSFDYRVDDVEYGAETPAFTTKRADTRSHLNLQASYNFRDIGFDRMTLDVGIKNYDNASNVALYEHTRAQYYAIVKYVVF